MATEWVSIQGRSDVERFVGGSEGFDLEKTSSGSPSNPLQAMRSLQIGMESAAGRPRPPAEIIGSEKESHKHTKHTLNQDLDKHSRKIRIVTGLTENSFYFKKIVL